MSFRLVSISALAASQLAFAHGAYAQDAAAPPATAESTSGDDIIVTAERREQSLQKLPTAASVVTVAGTGTGIGSSSGPSSPYSCF